MIEFLSVSFLYSLAKDGVKAILHDRRRLTNSQRLELRQKWKPLFEARLWETRTQELREDVIIRDVKRLDNYPELDAKKGISPWFRAYLVGTYHRGILLGLTRETLSRTDGKNWQYAAPGEKGGTKVVLLGSIPYESIDNVDWGGDEYYGPVNSSMPRCRHQAENWQTAP